MAELPTGPETLAAEIERLDSLTLDELKSRWLELKGVPLPKFMRRGLMTLAVAHALRESVLGGLDPATAKRLDQLKRQIAPVGRKPPPAPNRIKVGTRLVREWQGRVHEVMVVEDGFVWKGERHRSLSQIARLITGTRWNGWLFFGLKRTGAARASPSAPARACPKHASKPRKAGARAREAAHG